MLTISIEPSNTSNSMTLLIFLYTYLFKPTRTNGYRCTNHTNFIITFCFLGSSGSASGGLEDMNIHILSVSPEHTREGLPLDEVLLKTGKVSELVQQFDETDSRTSTMVSGAAVHQLKAYPVSEMTITECGSTLYLGITVEYMEILGFDHSIIRPDKLQKAKARLQMDTV